MYVNNKILVGKTEKTESVIVPKMVNRHGLITGATGSGKTTTVKVLAESFADAGIPVVMIDVKGDVAGTCKEGIPQEWITKKVNDYGLEHTYKKYSVSFFDVFQKNGLPLRTTVETIGSRLLSKMLGLSEAQEGILAIAFQVSQDENLKLINLNDLKQILSYIGENKDKYTLNYGNVTTSSVASIQRNILELEIEGGNLFFGEPAFDFNDLMQYDINGKGFINILDAQELYKNSNLYACVLVWMLNSLYDTMPEVGDLDTPKLALFLDEAHLIFEEMSSELVKKVTQIIKLIRSKGIGVYFISQMPSDIPEEILGQLGNKVQHVLRSYTPKDDKAIKAAADSFRANPEFKTEEAIKSLATGEALVSFLSENGEPSIVERTSIVPPQSFNGPISEQERNLINMSNRFYSKYINTINNESAEEKIQVIRDEKALAQEEAIKAKEAEKAAALAEKEKAKEEKEKAKAKKNSPEAKLAKQVGNKFINKATTKLVNSIWKGLFK